MRKTKMLYKDYKKLYSRYKTVYGSYNSDDKTIVVKLPDNVEYVPAETDSVPEWVEIMIDADNVKCKTNTSVCIRMPYCSDYKGYVLWISNKLFHDYYGRCSIMVKKDYVFRVKGKGKDKEISFDELAEAYTHSQGYPEIHIPEHLEPVYTEALGELRDAD